MDVACVMTWCYSGETFVAVGVSLSISGAALTPRTLIKHPVLQNKQKPTSLFEPARHPHRFWEQSKTFCFCKS